MSNAVDAIVKIRNEFPMGLVQAKALWDRHQSYEAMRDDLLGMGFRPASEGGESPKGRIERLEAQVHKYRVALDQIRGLFEGEAHAPVAARAVQIVDEVLDGVTSR